MENKYTVLYIEDNYDNRVLLERFLKFEGFEVHSAETGQKGLDQASKILPDVFLIDINLPDINGLEIVKILNGRVETQNIPKIVFTASEMQQEEILKAGFDYFMQKPIDVNTLAKKIEYVIQHSHGSRAKVER